MKKRMGIAALAALLLSMIIAGTVWAAFAFSGYTGPTVIQNNGDGTWNVQWTITVTELSNPDNAVCVTTGAGQVGTCGNTTGVLTCTANTVPNGSAVSWDISSYSGACGSGSKKIQGPTGTISPLAVSLAQFSAAQKGQAVQIAWETVSELDNRGFNLWRGVSPEGPDAQLNGLLIPAQSQGSPGGFVYTWEDRADLVPGVTYYYWLQDVDLSGAMTMHGPVSVDYAAPTAVTLSGVQASPAGGAAALSWLAVVAGTGVALALGRRK